MLLKVPEFVTSFAKSMAFVGGRALCVGGSVRDMVMDLPAHDWDMEVYGLSPAQLEEALKSYGNVVFAGKIYGVYRLANPPLDVSLPRKDRLHGKSHKDFDITVDGRLSFEEAFRRRDLTMNSIGFDPLTHEWIDPFGGVRDIEAKVLRATDPETFVEDPLRALRVAQFVGRFDMSPDPSLMQLCQQIDLSHLSGERVYWEFIKLLTLSQRPSLGFEFLRQTGLLRFFPALKSLIDVPQEPIWHPEGDVWTHTMMVIDEAASLRTGHKVQDEVLMFASLCHDFGKSDATYFDGEHIRSKGHEMMGVRPAQDFLGALKAPQALIRKVDKLIRWHLAPISLPLGGAKVADYNGLAREFQKAGVSLMDLYHLALADHRGRGVNVHTQKSLEVLEVFKSCIEAYGLKSAAPEDKVTGKMLMKHGIDPGPQIGKILKRCRAIQDEEPDLTAEAIIESALKGSV